MTEEPTYATVDDLACEVTDEEKAEKLLLRATRKIRALCGGEPKDPEVARDVCCAMVERVLATDETMVGAKQASITVGSYNQQWTWSNPNGDLYLTRDEKRALGISGMRVGFVPPRRVVDA